MGRARRLALRGGWLLLMQLAASAGAQPRRAEDRFDDTFQKYSKRYFGPAFDWRLFKAQGMAESNLDPKAKSWVGARGVMQLMPATFRQVSSRNPELHTIDNPEMNIAAGIAYDRELWLRWEGDSVLTDARAFVLGSYNAGRRTLLNAQVLARESKLDPRRWNNIETVAPNVKRWRHEETLGYVRRIAQYHGQLDDRGQLMTDSATVRGLKRK
ncbi:MAG: transglycosylase SLT domain-containing protein [Gemmatimonadaceae bacterium]|nr:transglycosylase SLT domain-containing protein [Gemmatimonadaceae bacterium]